MTCFAPPVVSGGEQSGSGFIQPLQRAGERKGSAEQTGRGSAQVRWVKLQLYSERPVSVGFMSDGLRLLQIPEPRPGNDSKQLERQCPRNWKEDLHRRGSRSLDHGALCSQWQCSPSSFSLLACWHFLICLKHRWWESLQFYRYFVGNLAVEQIKILTSWINDQFIWML